VPSVEIRDMVHGDLGDAWRINQLNVPAVGDETMTSFREIFDVSSVSLVVQADARLVGFCMILPPGTTYDSPNYLYFCERFTSFAYLDRVAFDEGHRGKGYGAALYREVESRLDVEHLTLEVNVKPRNEGSLRFHAREGFIEVDQMETRPGKIVSLMAKRLR
jgi:predicted GNAT superfamily acetyltransferase